MILYRNHAIALHHVQIPSTCFFIRNFLKVPSSENFLISSIQYKKFLKDFLKYFKFPDTTKKSLNEHEK